MSQRTPNILFYYFQDGPCDFHTKEQQVVDQFAVAKGVSCTWLNARSADAGPLLVRFNVTELPCLVMARTEPGRKALAIQRTFILTGPDLKNVRRLTKHLERMYSC